MRVRRAKYMGLAVVSTLALSPSAQATERRAEGDTFKADASEQKITHFEGDDIQRTHLEDHSPEAMRFKDHMMRTNSIDISGGMQLQQGNKDGQSFRVYSIEGDNVDNAVMLRDISVEGDALTHDRRGVAFEKSEDSMRVLDKPAGFDASSGKVYKSSCREIWFDAPHHRDDDMVYDCWQKIKVSNSDWIYNRYSKADPASQNGINFRHIFELTVRFRESKKHKNRITQGPLEYGPVPSQHCRDSGNVNMGFSGVGVTIPIRNCDNIENLAQGTRRASGTKWQGRRTTQVPVDSAARYWTNGKEPYMSDYVWLESRTCKNKWFCARSNTDKLRWNDSLW